MTILLLLVSLLSSAQAACTITLEGPPKDAVRIESPSFRWSGSADCVEYSVWFSPSGDFQSDDVFKTQRRTNTSFRMNAGKWRDYAATDWAEGVHWKVRGWTVDNVVSGSKSRFIFLNEPDTDGDGFSDAEEGTYDTDADGIPDYEDTDDDGDGLPSADEGRGDSDGDGYPDRVDPDDDDDGASTYEEDANYDGTPLDDDTDEDAIPNYLDTDDDGDGTPTLAEDTNGNGIPFDDDADMDGLPDYLDYDSP